MKNLIALAAFFLAACVPAFPTPDDFPPPPGTVIVEFPSITATATIEPRMRPILAEDLPDAETFLLILKTRARAGDDQGIADSVKYPIRIQIDGRIVIFNTPPEFLDSYDKIFTEEVIDALVKADEQSLVLLPEGIRVGDGEMWFNLFCVDLVCSDAQFLITQINP